MSAEPRYEDTQAAMDAATKAAWSAWAKSGDPAYAKALMAGHGTAKIDPHGSGPKGPDAVNALYYQSIGPAEITEEETSEIFDSIEDSCLIVGPKSKAAGATANALKRIKARWTTQNSSREVDFAQELLHVLGVAKDRTLRLKARCLKSSLLREEVSLSDLAKEYGMTRANTSKIAQELKKALNLSISTTTRNARFVSQCKTRAKRVHAKAAADRAQAQTINPKTKWQKTLCPSSNQSL